MLSMMYFTVVLKRNLDAYYRVSRLNDESQIRNSCSRAASAIKGKIDPNTTTSASLFLCPNDL